MRVRVGVGVRARVGVRVRARVRSGRHHVYPRTDGLQVLSHRYTADGEHGAQLRLASALVKVGIRIRARVRARVRIWARLRIRARVRVMGRAGLKGGVWTTARDGVGVSPPAPR